MADPTAMLGQEAALLVSFIDLLKKEQEALKTVEISALPTIGEQKTQLVERLNALELARSKAFGIRPGDSPKLAVERWLDQNRNNAALQAGWKKLLELAREAKQLHDLNARLVQMHLQQTNELLGALTQQQPGNSLYGANGQTWQRSGSRIVDSA